MSSYCFATNAETLLFLAWAARQAGLREALVEDHTRAPGKECEPLLRSWLKKALPQQVFEQDTPYSSCFQHLYAWRLEQVEYGLVGWALRGYNGVCYKDPSDASVAECVSGCANQETAVVWEAMAQHNSQLGKMLSRDRRLGDLQQGATFLEQHFRTHWQLHTEACTFLVQELVTMSLERVNWSELIARIKDMSMEGKLT